MLAPLHVVIAFTTVSFALPRPILNVSSLAIVSETNNASACRDSDNCRTMCEIVWSCLTTIFLCTWVSFHPELPSRKYTTLRIGFVRFITVCISILAPELVIVKAIDQWWDVQQFKPKHLVGALLVGKNMTLNPELLATSIGWTIVTHFSP